jgi:hypothetical protein
MYCSQRMLVAHYGFLDGFYLMRTCDNARELSVLLPVSLSHSLHNTWMIGTKVNEAMGDPRLCSCQERPPIPTVYP